MKQWKSLAVLMTLMLISVGCNVQQRERVVLIEPTYSYLRDEPTLRALDADTATRLDEPPLYSRTTVIE